MKKFDWHGYPEHYESGPGVYDPHTWDVRPWWKKGYYEAVRRDGAVVARAVTGVDDSDWRDGPCNIYEDDAAWEAHIAAYDAEHPLTPPPPKCGQVWVSVTADAVHEMAIVGVSQAVNGPKRVKFADTAWVPLPLLPPSDGVFNWASGYGALVAGPGSPWSPLAMGREY